MFTQGQTVTLRWDANARFWTGTVIAQSAPQGKRKEWLVTLLCGDGHARMFPVVT
jgi:hypothetical protein